MHHDYSQVLRKFEPQPLRYFPGSRSWSARCPAHDDAHCSLLIWVGRTGALMARCMANKGCTWPAIVECSGTKQQDWFPPKDEPRQRMRGNIVGTFPYHDARGQLLYEAVRIEPGQNGRKKDFNYRRPPREGEPSRDGWVWNLEGIEKIPYRLPEILDPKRKAHPVFLPEGEGKVEALRNLGLLATCNPCGAGKWLPEFGRHLRGRRCVILPDNDRDGRMHALQVSGSLLYFQAASIRIVHLPGLGEKGDIKDWIHALPELFTKQQCRKVLVDLVLKAPEYKRS